MPVVFLFHLCNMFHPKNVEKNFPNIFTLGLTLWTSSFYVDLVEISIILMLRWCRKREVSFLHSNWWISMDKRVILGFNVKPNEISISHIICGVINNNPLNELIAKNNLSKKHLYMFYSSVFFCINLSEIYPPL